MQIEKKTLKNIFLGVSACIILYWLLHSTENVKHVFSTIFGIISPFLLGAGLAFIFNVPMRAIEKRLVVVKKTNARRIVALVSTLLLIILILTLVFYLLIPQLIETTQSLIPKMKSFFTQLETKLFDFLAANPQIKELILKNTEIETFNWAGIVEKGLSVLGNSLASILTGMFVAIGSITDALVNAVIAVVFAIYCLCQKETLARQGKKLLYAFVPEKLSDEILRIVRLTNTTFSNFLSGQCIEVCILGAMFAICMAIFRMPYIPLVSVLIAVSAFIPVVGAFFGCICGAFLIFVANPVQAIGFVIMFLVIQQIENNVIYPRVVGTSIGLSGMWVLVAVAVGGELLGVAGMFIMIPIAAVIHTLLREVTDKRLHVKAVDPQKIAVEQQQPLDAKPFLRKKAKRVSSASDDVNEENN